MAADVSSLVRMLSRYNEEGEASGKGDLITRDFLGGRPVLGSAKELDLDLQAPSGWEKRLDLMSGKVYFSHRRNSSSSVPVHRHLQDLNLPPLSSAFQSPSLPNLLEASSLDLKMVTSSAVYQSVCTLEKVKSALEWESQRMQQRQRVQQSDDSPSPTSSSTTASSIKRLRENTREEEAVGESRSSAEDGGGGAESGSLLAAGCPSCLLYVLISKGNPKCPRCDSVVPIPAIKKPRIDLNYC